MNPCRACALPLPDSEVVCPRCGESTGGWAAEPAISATPSWAAPLSGEGQDAPAPHEPIVPPKAPDVADAMAAPSFEGSGSLRPDDSAWPVASRMASPAASSVVSAPPTAIVPAAEPVVPVAPVASPTPVVATPPSPSGLSEDPSRTVVAGRPAPAVMQHDVVRAMGPTLVLRVKLHGGLTGTVFRLGGTSVVGRFDPARGPVDVDLSSLHGAETVSRRHGQIVLRGGEWWVEDLRSANGVFVRTAAMTAPVRVETAQLVTGDEVSFGNVTFLATLEEVG